MKDKQIIYLIWELHNGVEPRLRTGYFDKKKAYQTIEQWNNREKKKTVHTTITLKNLK